MANEFGEFSEFSELNALGNPSKDRFAAEDGGKIGEGPIGNVLPTGVVAKGISIETSPTLYADKAVRDGMSTLKNKDAKRSESRKR